MNKSNFGFYFPSRRKEKSHFFAFVLRIHTCTGTGQSIDCRRLTATTVALAMLSILLLFFGCAHRAYLPMWFVYVCGPQHNKSYKDVMLSSTIMIIKWGNRKYTGINCIGTCGFLRLFVYVVYPQHRLDHIDVIVIAVMLISPKTHRTPSRNAKKYCANTHICACGICAIIFRSHRDILIYVKRFV